MSKKYKSVFMCSDCGNEYPSWQGQCSFCGSWNTIIEKKFVDLPDSKQDSRRRSNSNESPVKLSGIGTENYARIDTGINELNRVLGGGMVFGSLSLISGEPGIGKSTIIIEAANKIAEKYGPVLYVTGEESEEQVKLRADRVCGNINDNLYIFPETNIENVISSCENIKPCFLIIDSIQTIYSSEVDSVAGSVTQIRACSNLIMKFAKANNVPVFIVAHVTKSGDLAGPKTIEHMVDCVLNFTGERDRDLRILRSYKNRFGTTDEIGAFRMTSEGMIEVPDLSDSLIENINLDEGSVISASYEGSRPVFFEIQALVTQANIGFAKRTAIGVNYNRLGMILAVLEKKAGLNLLNHDVYANVVGGMKSDSPATDLAVALAIYSSARSKVSSKRIVAIGEIGLTGNIRSVPNTDKVMQEAVRLGYEAIILPKKNAEQATKLPVSTKIQICGVENIREAISIFVK